MNLVYLLIVKYLSLCLSADRKILISLIFSKFSHSILYQTDLSWNGGGGDFETVLEGSVDHIIYRDYIANRRLFIYCCLATSGKGQAWSSLSPRGQWRTQ